MTIITFLLLGLQLFGLLFAAGATAASFPGSGADADLQLTFTFGATN